MGTWDWEVSSMWFTISIWPHHVGTAGCSSRRTLIRRCSKDSAFPSPCSYSVLLVLPKKKKKKVEGFDVPEILEEAVKKELLFWIEIKSQSLENFRELKILRKKKKSSAYLCREQSWLCRLGMAPSSGLAPTTFQLHFPLLMSKLNYFGQSSWTFLFQNTKMGYFEIFFFVILFSN